MKVAISKKTIDFIFGEETGGKGYYEKVLARPMWAKGASGITIGGGYDCGYYSKSQIKLDWGGLISDDMIALLQSVAGKKGQEAANALTSRIISGVYIPYEVAYKQYLNRVVAKQVAKTVKAFPESQNLNADTLGMLTSVVYNRGTDMTDNDKQAKDRQEMRAIKSLVPLKDYKGIADQIRSMKRLWDGVPDYEGDHEQRFGGLLGRRDKEADGVINSQRQYDPAELVYFEI